MGEVLKSSAAERLERCRHKLTLGLFTHYGLYWAAVAELRDKWSITARPQVPPPSPFILLPPSVPEAISPPSPDDEDTYDPRNWSQEFHVWAADIDALHDRVAPLMEEDYGLESRLARDHRLWSRFLAGCVLFDPPRDRLLEFADWEPLRPTPFHPAESFPWTLDMDERVKQLPRAVAAPIVNVRNGDEVEAVYRAFISRLLSRLEERFAPQGLGVREAVDEILHNGGLLKDLREQLHEVERRPYIDVTPGTRSEDVATAFRLLSSQQENRPGRGRSERDPLLAVQCAVFRRLGWTEPEIAEHFGWNLSPDSYGTRRRSDRVRDHIELGEELLRERNINPEQRPMTE